MLARVLYKKSECSVMEQKAKEMNNKDLLLDILSNIMFGITFKVHTVSINCV